MDSATTLCTDLDTLSENLILVDCLIKTVDLVTKDEIYKDFILIQDWEK